MKVVSDESKQVLHFHHTKIAMIRATGKMTIAFGALSFNNQTLQPLYSFFGMTHNEIVMGVMAGEIQLANLSGVLK